MWLNCDNKSVYHMFVICFERIFLDPFTPGGNRPPERHLLCSLLLYVWAWNLVLLILVKERLGKKHEEENERKSEVNNLEFDKVKELDFLDGVAKCWLISGALFPPRHARISNPLKPFRSVKVMWRQGQNLLRRASAKVIIHTCPSTTSNRKIITGSMASSPSLSIWRRKKEIGKEGLIVAKELKRLQGNPIRLERFMKSHVSRLLKSDLVAVLAEFQRQDLVFLSMKLYNIVRKEIWYRPDMFFYRDMLMMLTRNKRVDEAKRVWEDLRNEEVLFDQHTFGDLVRAFLDSGLPGEAMDIYEEMRCSPDPPISLPYRVILKGLLPYPELREKVKDDFLELFPDMLVYDPPEDLFDDEHGKMRTSV